MSEEGEAPQKLQAVLNVCIEMGVFGQREHCQVKAASIKNRARTLDWIKLPFPADFNVVDITGQAGTMLPGGLNFVVDRKVVERKRKNYT